MAKLPINFLLYTLSLGMLGGVGWIFYQAIFEAPKKQKTQSEIKVDVASLLESGRKRQPLEQSWFYGKDATQDPWWFLFRTTNWIGKLPPPPPKAETRVTETKRVGPDIKIDDLLSVVAVSAYGNRSICVVRYKPSAGVTPPAVLSALPSDVISAPAANTRPPTPGPGARPGPAMPTPALDPSSQLIHHLKLEDTLWPPYSFLRLVEVAPDASRVWFLREKEGVAKEDWKKEEVLKGEYLLSEEMTKAVGQVTGRKPESRASAPTRAPVPMQTSGWVSVDTTQQLERGHWHISERDYHDLQERGNKILEEDLIVSSYKSPAGELRGVRVDRVSPELQRYGLQVGDVIVSVNDVPVGSKAEAATEGKKQYDRGTRDFKVTVFSKGERVDRFFHAPNK